MATWYAVGTGNQTWTSTSTIFATSSGGTASGYPSAGDTVIFDSHSSSGTYTTDATVPSLAAVSLNSTFTGTLKLGGAQTVTGAMTAAGGTFNTNGQTCSWGSFTNNSSTSTRVWTFGASAIAITGSSATVFINSSATGLTVSSNTATITFSGANATMNFGAVNWNGLSITVTGTGTFTTTGSAGGTFANFSYTPTAGSGNALAHAYTFTVTGTYSVTGASGVNQRVLVNGQTLGTAVTITVNTTVTASYVDFRDFTGAGTASWNLASITGLSGNCGNNSGITFTTAATYYAKLTSNSNYSSAGIWFTATNGGGSAGRSPLPQDTAVLDGNSGAYTLTLDVVRVSNLTTTSTPTGLKFTQNTYFYGSVEIDGSGSQTGTGYQMYLAGRLTTQYVQWVNLANDLYTWCPSKTYTVLNVGASSSPVISSTADFYHQRGTFSGGSSTNSSIQFRNFYMGQSGNAPAIGFGSPLWILTGNYVYTSGSITTAGPSSIVMSGTSGTQQFTGGGKTYPGLGIGGFGANFQMMDGGNTFSTLSLNGSSAETVTWPAGLTNTFTGAISVYGTAGNPLTMNSSTPGTAATIAYTGTPASSYMSVKDITVSGGTSWTCDWTCTNNGDNSNITFKTFPIFA